VADAPVRRRLTAILAADAVGYCRLMEEDENGTLAALKSRRRQVLDPLLTQHDGRLVKVMGDGVLVEFASAVDAARCAIESPKGAFRHQWERRIVALPTKQQKPPRLIKFLQDRLDHSRDVHGVWQAFALACATQESSAGV